MAPLFYVHSAFWVDDVKWLHSELLALISIAFGFLPKHNSQYKTQKIKYWYDTPLRGFWL